MILQQLLEEYFVELDEIFDIKSFNRNALIVFSNATSPTNDSSHVITDLNEIYNIHIQPNLSLKEHQRIGEVSVVKDTNSTIDVISITTRLYDQDVNYEGVIDTVFSPTQHYDNIFVEFVDGFQYEWLSDRYETTPIHFIM